jgi:NADH dehydrogenase
MKTIADALAIRRRVFGAFELAETATDPDEQRRWLTFAVVGAGPTGVELAGQIRELATRTLRAEFRRIRPEDARVLLFDGGNAPLASFGPALSAKAATALRDLGVELHLGSIVTGVDGEGLEVRDKAGTTVRHEAGTVLWAAGVEAPPVAEALAKATGAGQDRAGRIQVEPDLTIPGHPEISVIGDLMSLDKLPGVAEVAMQSGLYAGRRIRHRIESKETGPFRYYDLGSAAYLSRGNAVVSAGPLKFAGFAGWLGWLLIHIAFLTGYRNRAGAILTWAAAFARDARRERTFTTQQIERLRDVYDTPPGKDRPTDGP